MYFAWLPTCYIGRGHTIRFATLKGFVRYIYLKLHTDEIRKCFDLRHSHA